jgi:CRP-like cAMP-binding protein
LSEILAHVYSIFTGLRGVGLFVAEVPCRLHFIPFAQVQELEANDPVLALQLYRVLSRLVAEAADRNSDQLCHLMEMVYTFPVSGKGVLTVDEQK